jgi:hypothetical protein
MLVSWTDVPNATEYLWRLTTCDGRHVASGTTDRTSETKSSLRRGCYMAAVRVNEPLGPWGYSAFVELR